MRGHPQLWEARGVRGSSLLTRRAAATSSPRRARYPSASAQVRLNAGLDESTAKMLWRASEMETGRQPKGESKQHNFRTVW